MRHIPISGTDLHLSEIGLGTSNFGTHTDRDTAFQILDRFVESGGNIIDTAHIYGASRPEENSPSGETIGAWLASRGMRDHIFLCTKGAHPAILSGTHRNGPPRLNPADWRHDLDMSRTSLRTETIDLYFLHRDDPSVPVPEIIDALEECVHAGKIRFYGCSNWSAERIREAIEYAKEKSYRGFLFDQVPAPLARMNPLFLSATGMSYLDGDLLALHRETNLPVMSAMSLANGYFHRKAAKAKLSFFQRFVYGIPKNRQITKLVSDLKSNGIPVTAALIQFILSWEFPAVALCGFSSVEQMQSFLSEYATPIPEQALETLHSLRDPN